MIQQGLRTLLIGDGTISGLIGAAGAARCYSVLLPQKPTLPALILTMIDSDPDYTHQNESGIESATFQIDSWADDMSGTRALAAAVKSKLSGFEGAAGSEVIDSAFLTDQNELHDSELQAYRIMQQFDIQFH